MSARSCNEWQNAFWRALDGELPSEESAALAAHLQDCSRCRGAVRDAAAAHRAMLEASVQGDLAEAEGPAPAEIEAAAAGAGTGPRISSRRQRRVSTQRLSRTRRSPSAGWWIAAAAGVAVVAALLIYAAGGRRTGDGRKTARPTAPSAPVESGREEGIAEVSKAPQDSVPELTAPPRPQPEVATRPREDEERTPAVPQAPAPQVEPQVAEQPRPQAPPPQPQAPSRPAEPEFIATLVEAEGVVFIQPTPNERYKAPIGRWLFSGHGLITEGLASRAVIEFTDRTRIEVGPDTEITYVDAGQGKRIRMLRAGRLGAEVAKQPPGEQMLLMTPHAEARVLGTTFTLTVEAEKTRLEVQSGRVRFTRAADGKSADVVAGQVAEAGTKQPLVVRPATSEPVAASRDRVLWLRFEGDARDTTQMGLGGTVHGATFVTGKFGRAVALDGREDYIEIPHHQNLELTDGSIGVWIYVPSSTEALKSAVIFNKDAHEFGEGGHLSLGVSPSGAVQARFQSIDQSYQLDGSRPLSPDTWHHLMFTFGGDGCHLYLDGARQASQPYRGGIEKNTHRIFLGTWYARRGEYFGGRLDELIIYARQLSDTEVREKFQEGVGRP